MLSLIGAVAFEYAVEMTYPLPESISAGLLNITVQVSQGKKLQSICHLMH